MTQKKESNSPVSQEEHAQLEHVLEQFHQIANELHTSTKKEEAEAVLTDINRLSETSQVAFLKALSKERTSDAADIMIALNELSPNKSIRKEARRSLLRLEAAKVYPQWKPPVVRTPVVGLPLAHPPRFWKGYVTQSREEGEVQLILCWEQGIDYSEARMFIFLLDFWEQGLKEFIQDLTNKRGVEAQIQHMRTQLPDIILADCTLAEARRLVEEALAVNAWRGTTPHKEYRHYLPIFKQLVTDAEDVGEDRGLTFINPKLESDEVVATFEKYDRVALPVTDSRGVLVGMITVDDVLDVAEQKATEEIQGLGGVEALEAPYLDVSFSSMVRKRGGWLSALGVNAGLGHGHVDFAGSSVVHMTGGITGLAGALVLGPRLGKYRADGTLGAMPGHNLPMSVVGTLILAFGWFGFNAGSTLSASDPRIAIIAVNTMLASSAGAVAALFYVWFSLRKPDVGMACNGLLGGLVAITAPCAFVNPAAAVLIGLVAGVLVVRTVALLERRLRIDDPVGAIAVHGACGTWGALALGLFADGSYGFGWNGVGGPVRGLFFGDAGQLGAQLIGVATNIVFVFGMSFGFFRLIDRIMGNRVPAEVEHAGLDALEMGTDAYPRG